MSTEKQHIDGSHGWSEISGQGRPTNVDQQASTTSKSSGNYVSATDVAGGGSHPGLLALARILGRSAAQADLRRTRRGAVAIMGMVDATLVIAALIAGALMWSVIVRLR